MWGRANFNDDPVKQSNKRGFVTFAKTGAPNSRSTQFFINYGDNANLDPQGFAPFGQVIAGMDVVDKLDELRRERPDQGMIIAEGNAYLQQGLPEARLHQEGDDREAADATRQADQAADRERS